MNFRPIVTQRRIDPRARMVVTQRFSGLNPGDDVPKCSVAKRRRWLRLGLIMRKEDYENEELAIDLLERGILVTYDPNPDPAPGDPDPAPGDPDPAPSDDGAAAPVSATDDGTGWWTCTYSDGSTSKMRRAQVVEHGLIDDLEE
jgi:hypothetical protein